MKNLIQFLVRYSIFFLFLLLEIIAVELIVHNTGYQRMVFLSSANSVAARMYEVSGGVVNFFHMKRTNAQLAQENAALHNEITYLQNEITRLNNGYAADYIPVENDLEYIPAKIINNSTNRHKNYITVNKGRRDGVQAGMGVVSAEGVVGIVKTASDKFAVVIPILNSEISINSKFKSNNYVGPVEWDSEDYRYAQLKDIARHVQVHKGDTIVTSGLTTVFPEGIPVGIVEECSLGDNDAYHHISIKLAVNFRTLSYVQIIKNNNRSEWEGLEKAADTANPAK